MDHGKEKGSSQLKRAKNHTLTSLSRLQSPPPSWDPVNRASMHFLGGARDGYSEEFLVERVGLKAEGLASKV